MKWDLVQAWVQRGWLDVVCVGGRWRITGEALTAALSSSQVVVSLNRSRTQRRRAAAKQEPAEKSRSRVSPVARPEKP